ncbi:glutamine amidotransferase subunit PdxT [Microlunatus phosphovorus NM-1]|uniref:Pyridoxal 5'-phosphate synthase subunit PdxT n=1 Tax=Microlunatus phosphovorus (strain ATCC 700054 / DSM 10555 / JCM 9379 / NBRC 101784 / NCIMB 13414 / VKM Ac-1990 / NM-1) TaxID=1032480 RepID=F5XI11_MICPN|nr:pyridoxal 5'-phosphate synthase glutaminase subunit PdxT [Microlunatus phosphovorus]BAK35680.1 glutamine amidotransferase subunit PdxT [Microlunatus phosphovorus NM-1]
MTARPVIGVLALQGDVREHAAMLVACGAEPRAVRRPEELTGLAGIVIPGGESTTIDKLSRIFELRDPLVAAIRAGLPAYGSCAGMIMLANRLADAPPDQQTFGGLNVTVRRNAFGRQTESFEADLTGGWPAGEPFRAVFIRAPEVVAYGPEIEVLATVPRADGSEHVVAVRQGSLLATAFHPEVAGDARIHAYFVELACNVAAA